VFHADATDFDRLGKAFARLPSEIKHKAAGRALRRISSMGMTQVVKRAAERIDIPQKHVRDKTRSSIGGEAITVTVRSDWIALSKLGARETRAGVTVRARGSYAQAFIARSKISSDMAVMRRAGQSRLPVNQLFGPNPANDINTDPGVYLDVMAGIASTHLLPRMLHELGRLLPR
jgi:hypothetical protein